ncbi:MAG: rRNA maturation RNase YbeY [Alphaproteobacteria bacterium]
MKIKNKKLEISFIGDKNFKEFFQQSKKQLNILMTYFQSLHHIEGFSEICIKIVSDPEIKMLNKNFRNKNKITDVISFGDVGFSGDIAITESYIKTNSKYSSQNFFMLLVHGMLHLFGYSHYDRNNRETMRMLENICMTNLGLKKTHEV